MYNSTHSLTPALDGGECSASCTGRFIPRERAPGTHWMGGRSERRGEEKISLHLLEIEPR